MSEEVELNREPRAQVRSPRGKATPLGDRSWRKSPLKNVGEASGRNSNATVRSAKYPHGDKNAVPLGVKALGLAEPDPIFQSPLVSLFICRVMRSGKKSLAKKIVYAAFARVLFKMKRGRLRRRLGRKIVEKKGLPKTRTSAKVSSILGLFERSVLNVLPSVKVLEKKRGRTVLYYPRRTRSGEGVRYALKWIVDGSERRTGRTKGRRLSQEIRAALHGRGAAWDKKKAVYRLATTYRFFFPRKKKRTRWKGRPVVLAGEYRGKHQVFRFRADWPDYWKMWNRKAVVFAPLKFDESKYLVKPRISPTLARQAAGLPIAGAFGTLSAAGSGSSAGAKGTFSKAEPNAGSSDAPSVV